MLSDKKRIGCKLFYNTVHKIIKEWSLDHEHGIKKKSEFAIGNTPLTCEPGQNGVALYVDICSQHMMERHAPFI